MLALDNINNATSAPPPPLIVQSWADKYAPERLSDVILPEATMNIIKTGLEVGDVGSYTFYSGMPGTGKTTTAKIIAKEMGGESQTFYISKDSKERIEQIAAYASYSALNGKPRYCILDECDKPVANFKSQFFNLLQTLIEDSQSTLRFILTCNHVGELPPPVLSRCPPVSFAHSKDDRDMKNACYKRLEHIATTETAPYGGNWEKKTLVQIVDKCFPDIRKMIYTLRINFLENSKCIKGEPNVPQDKIVGTCYDLAMKGDAYALRAFCKNNLKDYNGFFSAFADCTIAQLGEGKHRLLADVMILTGEYQYRSASSVDQELNCFAYLYQIMKLFGKV